MSVSGRVLGLVVALALVARPAAAQLAEPMQIRNLNPLVAIFGLPAWDTVAPGNRFSASLELANHYEFSKADGDFLGLDGETARTTLAFSHGFPAGWQVGVELPLFHLGGGVLDNAIDALALGFRFARRGPKSAAAKPTEFPAPPFGPSRSIS